MVFLIVLVFPQMKRQEQFFLSPERMNLNFIAEKSSLRRKKN